MTKTKEEAAREEEEKKAADEAAGARTVIDSTDTTRNKQEVQHTRSTKTDNAVIERAETEAIKTEKRGSNEESVPHRTLMTVRSPSAERSNDRAGMTLPIVDEIGESSSTGGRSATDENEEEREARPPTPPKDERNVSERRPKNYEQKESFGSNKILPPLPRVNSPEPMNEKESVIV